MKTDDAFEFALRAAAFAVVGRLWSCTNSTGRCLRFAAEMVMLKAEAVGTPGGSIEQDVFHDLEATSKEEATQGSCGGGLSKCG